MAPYGNHTRPLDVDDGRWDVYNGPSALCTVDGDLDGAVR